MVAVVADMVAVVAEVALAVLMPSLPLVRILKHQCISKKLVYTAVE